MTTTVVAPSSSVCRCAPASPSQRCRVTAAHRSRHHLGPSNTKISCEGRHRGCPDLVSCILLFSVCSLIQLRGSLPSVSSSSDAATGRLLALSSSAQPQPSTLAPGRCCPESIPPVSGARSLSTFLAVGYGEHQDQLRGPPSGCPDFVSCILLLAGLFPHESHSAYLARHEATLSESSSRA
jgi:hypothetical protein